MADVHFEFGSSPLPGATGSHGTYDWLTTELDLEELLRLCPELVFGKYLAVTSRDSGPLNLTDSERDAGWISRGGIAYSPQIESVEGLLHLGTDRAHPAVSKAPDYVQAES